MNAPFSPHTLRQAPNSKRFRCVVLDAKGESTELFMDAASEAAAAQVLTAQGLTPLTISQRGPSLAEVLTRPITLGNSINRIELTGFTDRLSLLLKAGLTLAQALELEARSVGKKSTVQFATRLEQRIKEGMSFANALQAESKLPSFYVGVVRAAEKGGRLAAGLNDLASSMKLADQTRSQLISTLTYPALVLLSTMIALIFVLTYVIPNFEPLFEGETARLPGLTRTVLSLSHAINSHGLLILITLAILVTALWLARRTPAVTTWWHGKLTGKSRLFDLVRLVQSAQALRITGTQIVNGVHVPDALEAAAQAASSPSYAQMLKKSAKRVREGESLTRIFSATPLMPATATKLIEVGETGGTLGPMMLQAAQLFEAQAKTRLERLVAIANPLAIMILGALVAAMIASVMIGIFSIEGMAGG
jgi:general secretion pathway protein F